MRPPCKMRCFPVIFAFLNHYDFICNRGCNGPTEYGVDGYQDGLPLRLLRGES